MGKISELRKQLEEKQSKIDATMNDAKHAATNAKTWASIAHEKAVALLNHLRDISATQRQILDELYRTQEILERAEGGQ